MFLITSSNQSLRCRLEIVQPLIQDIYLHLPPNDLEQFFYAYPEEIRWFRSEEFSEEILKRDISIKEVFSTVAW